MEIRECLLAKKDEAFQQFQSRIVPNVPQESIIGIRVPELRRLAKEYRNTREAETFLSELPHSYYEENMLHIMLLCLEKDFQKCVEGLDRFLPYADNWAVTDQPTPKCFAGKHRELEPILQTWLASEHPFTARFAVNMYMHEYLGEDFDVRYPEMIAKKQGDDYYLQMVIAWYFATGLAKQYEAFLPFIEGKMLSPWIHNKAIQKAQESFRVTEGHKSYLRSLKIDREAVAKSRPAGGKSNET